MRAIPLFTLVCIAVAGLTGCVTTRKAAAPPPPPYMTEAVLKSFDNIFDGSWSGVKIHIEPSAYVPDDLKRAGKSEAEVLDRETLIEKFKSSEQAPAMAVVNAFKANGGLVHVQIEYFPVRTRDWHEATIERGMYEFVYRRTKDRLVMLRRTKSTF